MSRGKRKYQQTSRGRSDDTADLPSSVVLTSGATAVLAQSKFFDDAIELIVDGHPQSIIFPDHPARLQYEYIRRIGDVIDALPGVGIDSPITALHLGAGACTLPRYIAAQRPGSRQQVLELEPNLIALVRQVAGLPRGIRVRYGDARATLKHLPEGIRGSVDLVVHDVYAGDNAPSALRTTESFDEVRATLSPQGIFTMNLATLTDRLHVHQAVASVDAIFDRTAVLADPSVLNGKHHGNLTVVASEQPFPSGWIDKLVAKGPKPARSLTGTLLSRWIAGARPFHDA